MVELGVGLGVGKVIRGKVGPTYDPAATAFFARITADPGSAVKGHYNDFFVALRDHGIFDLLDFFKVYAGPDAQASKLNLIQPAFDSTPVSAPVFTPFRGFAMDGVSSYFNSNFNPITANGKYQRLSAHIGIYSRTDALGTLDIGARVSSALSQACIGVQANLPGQRLHRMHVDAAFANPTAGPANSLGHFVSVRDASASCPFYCNGTLGIAAAYPVSAAMPNFNFYEGAANNNGVVLQSAARQYAAVHAGAALTATQIGQLYTALQALLTAFGANV